MPCISYKGPTDALYVQIGDLKVGDLKEECEESHMFRSELNNNLSSKYSCLVIGLACTLVRRVYFHAIT